MNKSTIVLLLLAALGLGSLIGTGFTDNRAVAPPTVVRPSSPDAVEHTGGAPRFRFIAPGDLAVEMDDFDRAKPSAIGENFIARDTAWNTQTVVVELPIEGSIEYKVIMGQGDAIVFDWSTDSGEVYSDFHGHDKAFGKDFFVRYQEHDGAEHSGTIVAPFAGEHGWYWLNMRDGPITITLRVAGFFEKIVRLEIEEYK